MRLFDDGKNEEIINNNLYFYDLEPYQNMTGENPEDPKEKIALYQLFKAQFVFTIAQRQNNNLNFVLLSHTSVESQIITEENIVKKS